MNMMFSSLFGVGYNIVRYRKNGVLKRLRATPLSAIEFLLAQVFSRLLLITFVTTSIYLGCHYFIHFRMLGSYCTLFFVMSLGAMCLISLSLLVASRISSEEFAGGLLNLISWPMMFLSGVWFSLEGAHPLVKKAAQIFPLTHVIDAARAIMTEGAGLPQISYHIIVLAAMTVVFLVAGALAFQWK
jgi:ABC-2 type transport system permease protein